MIYCNKCNNIGSRLTECWRLNGDAGWERFWLHHWGMCTDSLVLVAAGNDLESSALRGGISEEVAHLHTDTWARAALEVIVQASAVLVPATLRRQRRGRLRWRRRRRCVDHVRMVERDVPAHHAPDLGERRRVI
eukprot:COSAG06_NODE_5160_length_3671_cov_98.829507_3_plen_134_part_00